MVKRRDDVVTADRRLREHRGGGGKLAIKVPAGLSLFNPEKAGTYLLTIFPCRFGKAIKKFVAKETKFCDPGQKYYEQTYYAHRGIGPNNVWVVCAAKTFNKPCYVCQHIMKMSTPEPDEDLQELKKKLYAKQRQLWLVLNHGEKDKGLQLWEYSYALFGKYLDAKLNTALPEERKRWINFADPVKGYDIRASCTKESLGGGTYLEFSDISFKKRKQELDEELVEKAEGIDLSTLVEEPNFKDVKKMMLQTGEDITEDDDDDDDEDDTDDDTGDDDEDTENDEESDDEDEDESEDEDEDGGSDEDDEDDDGDDEDSDEEDEDEEDEDDGDIEAGMKVAYVYKKKRHVGVVTKIKKGKGGTELAYVKVKGKDMPAVVDLDELEPLGKASKPPKKSKKKVEDEDDEDAFDPDDEDDEDEDDAPRKKKRKKVRA